MMGLNYSRIRATTAGERLFQRIAGLGYSDLSRARLGEQKFIRLSGRREPFGDYLEGALFAFTFKRVVKMASGIADQESADAAKYLQRLRGHLANWFDWLEDDPLSMLVRDTKRAQEASHRSIPKGTAATLWGGAATHACCFCGRSLTRGPGGRFFDDTGTVGDLEHVWPRSLGGDSVEDNLVPACSTCNKQKADMFIWEDETVHSMVYPVGFGTSSHLPNVPLRHRLTLQRRAVLHLAQRDRLTLKAALLAVGPYGDMRAIDNNDTWDFFNLQNHAASLGETLW